MSIIKGGNSCVTFIFHIKKEIIMRKKNEITRKLAMLLCAVLAAGAIMTGCGGSSSSAPAEEAAEAVSEVTEEAAEAVSEAVEEEVPVVEETATTEAAAVSATAAEGATIAAVNTAAFATVFNGSGAITGVSEAEDGTVEAQELTEDTLNAAVTLQKGDAVQDNPSVVIPKQRPPFTSAEQSLLYLIDFIRTSAYTQDVFIYYGYEDGCDVFIACSIGSKKIGVDTIYESDLRNAKGFIVERSSGYIASFDEYGNVKMEKY